MKRILVLEDDIERMNSFNTRFSEINWREFDIVSDAALAIKLLSENKYVAIFLDHDLDRMVYVDPKEKNTGSEVARWIKNNKESVSESIIFIHSLNEMGASNMFFEIKKATPLVFETPYAWTIKGFMEIIEMCKDNKKNIT